MEGLIPRQSYPSPVLWSPQIVSLAGRTQPIGPAGSQLIKSSSLGTGRNFPPRNGNVGSPHRFDRPMLDP